MKKFTKLLFFIMIFMLTIGVTKTDTPIVFAEDSVTETRVATGTFIDYIPVVSKGKFIEREQIVLDESSTITGPNNPYGKSNHAYILANDATSVTLLPFKHKYSFSLTNEALTNYFNIHITKITIEKNTEDYNNKCFTYNGVVYYFALIAPSNLRPSNPNEPQPTVTYMAFYNTPPISASSASLVTSLNTSAITYEETEDGVVIRIIDSFSLKKSDSKNPVEFSIGIDGDTYRITFLKTVVRFANAENPVASFRTYKDFNVETNMYNYDETDNWLQKEQTFTKLDFSFLNDKYEYLEDNPLYFNINFNGFLYEYKLYSSDGYLFVNYTDKEKLKQLNKKEDEVLTQAEKDLVITELATIKKVYIDKDFQTGQDVERIEYETEVDLHSIFTLSFTYRGRYEVEIFDDTHRLGFENANYYKTSFYIKDDTTSADSIFDNIYILAQTIDEELNPIEYIVNGATLNNSVTSIIKNLSDFSVDGITLTDIISKVDVTYTEFGNSDNLPTTTTYLPDQINELIKDTNGDLKFSFDVDGYYQVVVYNVALTRTIEYNFTIVKHAKTTYTIDGVTHEATTPYKTIVENYSNIISNSDPIRFTVYYDNVEAISEKKLDISYLNTYQIIYGVQQVSITYETDEKNLVLTIECLGVGDMILTVTGNDKVMEYNLNSEEQNGIISISEYGNYTFTLVDSMGTTATSTYNFAKKMNTSTLILIGVSSFIALAIALFIFSVRGKVRTR